MVVTWYRLKADRVNLIWSGGYQNEYQDRIRSVRMADDLSRKERRKKVQELKYRMDKEIIDTRKNYYKSDSNG